MSDFHPRAIKSAYTPSRNMKKSKKIKKNRSKALKNMKKSNVSARFAYF